jgi:heterodisulfide reductase subunit B
LSNYALFLGCTVPARTPSYELSLRKVLKVLDIKFADLENLSCCAPIPIESLNFKSSLSIAAYNISVAEEAGLNLVTICNGCFQMLIRANSLLKDNVKMRKEINKVLSEVGKEYRGTIEVYDYLQILHSEMGIKKIKKNISKPLSGLKVSVFYGCHLLRPSSTLKFDDPFQPKILDELVELTGAKSLPYDHKDTCCGGLLRGTSDELATKLARDRFFNISKASGECIVTVCPFCFLQHDLGQLSVNRNFEETYKIPVFHYPELLGLSLGIKPVDLGLKTHRISTESVIQKLGLE